MKKYGQHSNLSTYVQVIILQKRINLPTANMGSRPSKRKYNKEGHKQKLCKSLGRNQLKVEGNFQFGYHSEIDKKYEAVDAKFLSQEEDISEINKKYEVDHAKHLAIIPEEGEENGRVPDTTVLQS